jgi:hypothetical protein
VSTWTSRLPPSYTRAAGCEELHCAWFVPRGYAGRGPVVTLSLPECELRLTLGVVAGVPVIGTFDNPRPSVAHWIKDACAIAIKHRASLCIVTDTGEQLTRAARLAAKRLPGHERAALERMADPGARARAKLN